MLLCEKVETMAKKKSNISLVFSVGVLCCSSLCENGQNVKRSHKRLEKQFTCGYGF